MILSFNRFARLGLLVIAVITVAPAHARAEWPTRAAIFDYGFEGFLLGVEIGLPVGYIATGSRYEKSEWRSLVLGTGVGGLTGVVTGLVSAVFIDRSERGAAFQILEKADVGARLFAVLGAGVGALVWVANENDSLRRDMLLGSSIGALAGAVAGAIYGASWSASANREYCYGADTQRRGIDFSLAPLPAARGAGMAMSISGPFDL